MQENNLEIVSLVVNEEDEKQRLDVFLANKFDDKSRSFFQNLITDGQVSVNGKVIGSKKYKVETEDRLEIKFKQAQDIEILPQNIPLDIVYEDKDVLVVNKPKGMVVHPAPSNYKDTLVNAIMYHCKDSLSGINGKIRPGIVHRIDKDTSGLLMIAKNDHAHNLLAEQLKEHKVNRRYKAIVQNGFKEDDGSIDKPIGRDKKNPLRRAVDYQRGKEAKTHFKVVERLGGYTLIECKLETGRTHQIRVHMASINHKLLGDDVYGEKNTMGIKGQMLHAYKLGFIHPLTREYMEFEVDEPEHFKKALKTLRIKKENN